MEETNGSLAGSGKATSVLGLYARAIGPTASLTWSDEFDRQLVETGGWQTFRGGQEVNAVVVIAAGPAGNSVVEDSVDSAIVALWEVQKSVEGAEVAVGIHLATDQDSAVVGARELALFANRDQILVSGSVDKRCTELDARPMGMVTLTAGDEKSELLWLLTDSRMNVGRLPLNLPD